MNEPIMEAARWKEKIRREVKAYLINFVYMAIFFGLFTWYRRLILAEYRIAYLNYGFSILKALVLAKAAMLGGSLNLGRRFEDRPLLASVFYKALVFSVWVAVFDVAEHTMIGLVRDRGPLGGIEEIAGNGGYELLARSLIVFCAFIPFFAFKELGRTLGEAKIHELFWGNRRNKP